MMDPIKIINQKEKEKIIKKLNDQFGIVQIKETLIKIGEENIFLYAGNFKEFEIQNFEKIIGVEKIGIYFGKIKEEKIILSMEAIQILKDQISKNILEINEQQVKEFMKGNELLISSKNKGYSVIKYKEDFLGLGKASEEKISSLIPKSRRLKNNR